VLIFFILLQNYSTDPRENLSQESAPSTNFNYFLTIIGFSIYKAYYISEQKTKSLDVYSLFVREYNLFIFYFFNNNNILFQRLLQPAS
jgi:hypothetical protein